tara:strand:- start:217 stop:441 length:225 start_codon:yes stop_codon:yes gene_type:complete
MKILILPLLLLLAGCAPKLSVANERGGIVDHVSGLTRNSAFKLADNHCRKFGRVARISGQDALQSNFSFDCIAP